MTMVLPTFPERKVGRTEGYSNIIDFIEKTPSRLINLIDLFNASLFKNY